jgi:hypothetical protein
MPKMKSAYKVYVGKAQGKMRLGGRGHTRENIIEIYLSDIRSDGIDSVDQVPYRLHDRLQCTR